MERKGKPRYLHVFASDKSPCLGNFERWAQAPKYGGVSGLEPLPADFSHVGVASDATQEKH